MARRSRSYALLWALAAVGLVLFVLATSVTAGSEGELQAEVMIWPLALKMFVSLIGAAVAITVLLHYLFKIFSSGEGALPALPTFVIPFLAGCALLEASWAALLALTVVIAVQMVVGYLSTRQGPADLADSPPPGPEI